MMKRLIAVFLFVVFAAPVMAEDVNERLDAAPDGLVHISNIAGAVTVVGWSRNEVEVTGQLGRKVEKLIVERDGDKVTIKVKVPRNGGRGIDSDLHVQVPQGSSLDVGTVSADIDVSEVRGEQRLNTVSGDVATEGFGSDISIEAVSGDIEVAGQQEDAETDVNTVSGDITLFRVAGEMKAETVSGDVIIDEGSFDRVSANTVNGDISFRAALRADGRLQAETVNGSVDVNFANDVAGRFEVDTFNGSIRNCFGPKAERTSKYTPGWELSFEDEEGNARVEISTLNGSVELCR